MNNSRIRLAILSPSKNAYSETFIQAHKRYLDAEVSYYFGGFVPRELEDKYSLVSTNKRVVNKIRERLTNKFKTSIEYSLFDSFKKEGIEIVLAEYGPTASATLEVCKALGLPMIVHFHGYDATKKEVVLKNNSYSGVFGYANKVIVVSREMRCKVLDLGCPEEKLLLNTYGPNDSFQQVEPNFSEQWFMGIGRFVDKKAPYYLILSLHKVLKQYKNARLILAGNGYLMNTCINLASYLGISEKIDFVGVISPEEYASLLTKITAFVQHSVTADDGDMEGTPLAVLEASAAGVPVISTKHAGIPDVIIDGETGLLVEEHDVEGMANAMCKVLADKVLAKKMGTKGKQFIQENFSMNKHIGLLDDTIKTCLS